MSTNLFYFSVHLYIQINNVTVHPFSLPLPLPLRCPGRDSASPYGTPAHRQCGTSVLGQVQVAI